MKFNYLGFHNSPDYQEFFGMRDQFIPQKMSDLATRYKPEYNSYEQAIIELKKRATEEYCKKVEAAQAEARNFSEEVFLPYRLMAPETIADDWLSMVDWHKEHNTRDHSLHQPLTAYIVRTMLGYGVANDSLELPNGKKLLEYCVDEIMGGARMQYIRDRFPLEASAFVEKGLPEKREWASMMFYETAVIAALFHDMGYPWQYINRLLAHLEVTKTMAFYEAKVNGIALWSFLKDKLLAYPFYGYQAIALGNQQNAFGKDVPGLMEDAFRRTHGMPGAIAFLMLNEITRRETESNDLKGKTCQLITDWAALGILMHDMLGQYYLKSGNEANSFFRLSFDVDPLSCLIAMSDVLEEFQRPKAVFDTCDYKIALSYEFECDESEIRLEGDKMTVVYRYKSFSSEQDKQNKQECRSKEIKKYFEGSDSFIDLSPLGIHDVDCMVELKDEE